MSVAKLGDFGLPIDFGPRLPIPWLENCLFYKVSSLGCRQRSCVLLIGIKIPFIDQVRISLIVIITQFFLESDVWMFGILAWECATLGAEPHYQRNFEEIQQCFELPDRGLTRPPSCPAD
jgi:hypothetical protein